eukprot:217536-Alexandrium_andersonii.AAC.1
MRSTWPVLLAPSGDDMRPPGLPKQLLDPGFTYGHVMLLLPVLSLDSALCNDGPKTDLGGPMATVGSAIATLGAPADRTDG